jgi:dTDP-4-amino-4,6-dideoxygalactose transaminase
LKHLDDYIEARQQVAAFYDKAFETCSKIKTPFRASYSSHVFHQYTLILEGVNRDELHKFLTGQKIPSMIYYPVAAHQQKMFSQFNVSALDLPVIDWLIQRVISLPMHTEMDEEQLHYISSKVIEFVNR